MSAIAAIVFSLMPHCTQDRIVLLEYELRLSKDDIHSLKSEVKQLRARQLRHGKVILANACGAFD